MKCLRVDLDLDRSIRQLLEVLLGLNINVFAALNSLRCIGLGSSLWPLRAALLLRFAFNLELLRLGGLSNEQHRAARVGATYRACGQSEQGERGAYVM